MSSSNTRRFVAFQRRWLRAFDRLAAAYGVQGSVLAVAFAADSTADFRAVIYRAFHDGDLNGNDAELLLNHGGGSAQEA